MYQIGGTDIIFQKEKENGNVKISKWFTNYVISSIIVGTCVCTL
nr:MAG TPA: hypothetical protein [Caudoviricetes sp.]